MGILLAFASAFGYAWDATLMARHYRSIPAMYAVALRGIALSVVGIPLLLIADPAAYAELPAYLPHLALAGLTAVIANWGYANATRVLPCGVANAGVMALQVFGTAVLAYLVFGEILSFEGTFLVLAMLSVNLYLALGRYTSLHALKHAPGRGIMLTTLAGSSQSVTFLVIALVAREVNPFLAAYVLELMVAFWATAASFTVSRERAEKLDFKRLPAVMRDCWVSVPALACYAIAVSYAPVALVQGIYTSVALFAATLGAVLFRERLKRPQAVGMVSIVGMIALFQIAPWA